MTNPTKRGLYLHVVSEPYQVECDGCKGTGFDPTIKMDAYCPECEHWSHADRESCGHRTFANPGLGIRESFCDCKCKDTTGRKCNHCHGTGQRTVRLEGFVPVPYDFGRDYTLPEGFDISAESGVRLAIVYRDHCERKQREYTAEIVERYRAHQLPASIAAGLREIEIKGDDNDK